MGSASQPDCQQKSTAEASDSFPEREHGRGKGISNEPGGTSAELLGLQAATGTSVRPASDNPCNVLVTGGAGYIGSHTSKALAQAGYTPVVIDDLSTGHRESVRWGPFVEGNIADRSLVRAVLRRYDIAAVIHFAGSALVGESMCDPGMYFRNNAAAGTALLDAMCAEGVKRIVFASSCATYGYPQSVPISETHPQVPANPYGESKLAVERQLRWFGEIHGLRYVALRYFNAAGADPEGELGEEHTNETHIVPLVIHAILGKLPHFLVLGDDYATPDGTAVRDYIHVSDLAAAHVKALAYLRDGRGERRTQPWLGQGAFGAAGH